MRWLNDLSRQFLSKGYLSEGQTAEDRVMVIAKHAEEILKIPGFSTKFYEYMSKGFYSLSSPIWANFGLNRGLPISCFGGTVLDDMSQILYSVGETGMMSKYGGGTSGFFGDLRHRGAPIKDNGVSSGSVHFMQLFQSVIDVVSQGSTRRGHYAPYLPVEHKDIHEFLEIGTEGNPIQNLTHGVTVSDRWMKEMIDGDVEKRRLWAKVIQRRAEMGYPYLLFTDTVNRNTVDCYKDKQLKITHSNLCTEIMLPDNSDWSFVCDLSSMNLLYYDEWKTTDAVETLTYFLDAVMTDFITKLEKLMNSRLKEDQEAFFYMRRAYQFAKDNRALGLGVLGWHSYLQSKMISFESLEANKLNVEIFRFIKERAYQASIELATLFEEAPVTKGYRRRNATLNAVAPTTSSSFILGQVSQSIEPIWSNCYVKDIDKVKVTIHNQKLKELLKQRDMDTKEIWQSIRDHDGSVQHLTCLTDQEKDVFKTFAEIDPYVIIDQAASRQHYIDQGQSLNLMISQNTSAKEINQLYIYAWENGIKSLYYQHATNAAQKFNQSKLCQQACEA